MGRTSFRQISFDIDLDEVYSEMGSKDCEEMTRWLYEDGYLDEYLEKEINIYEEKKCISKRIRIICKNTIDGLRK